MAPRIDIGIDQRAPAGATEPNLSHVFASSHLSDTTSSQVLRTRRESGSQNFSTLAPSRYTRLQQLHYLAERSAFQRVKIRDEEQVFSFGKSAYQPRTLAHAFAGEPALKSLNKWAKRPFRDAVEPRLPALTGRKARVSPGLGLHRLSARS